VLSQPLVQAIEQAIGRRAGVLLFLNRKGYAGALARQPQSDGAADTTAGAGYQRQRRVAVEHGGDLRAGERRDVRLRDLAPLDPLHNGPALAGIEATLPLGVPLVAAFDTTFHRTLPELAWRYAIPAELEVRRYGFHGWSHRSVTQRYTELTGSTEPTIVTLHLGGGCSATAVQRGRSVDTSMGYSPLEGLVMGTRPGDLDPGVLTHLLQEGMSLDRIVRLFNRGSGLVALAGTADMRELLRRNDAEAALAIDLFCYRIRKYVGAYLAVLEGAEAIVVGTALTPNSIRWVTL